MSATKKPFKNKNVKDLAFYIEKLNQAIRDGEIEWQSPGILVNSETGDDEEMPVYCEAMDDDELSSEDWDKFDDYFQSFTYEKFVKVKNS